jgi:hypothetical protein
LSLVEERNVERLLVRKVAVSYWLKSGAGMIKKKGSKNEDFFFIPVATVLLLTSCTTVDDFRKMSPSERAARVCGQQQKIILLINQKAALSSAIQTSKLDLGRGYKVHKHCQQVRVYGQATTTCQNNFGTVRCTEDRPESLQTKCTESPVAINADLERNNIQSWSVNLAKTEQNLKNEWQSCTRYIGNLSADEAFTHYK